MGLNKNWTAGVVMAALSLSTALHAQTEAIVAAPRASDAAPAGASERATTTVALIALVGDKLTIVSQKQGTGSHLEPYTRKTVPVDSQIFNMMVLRGLDDALRDEEPQSQRVMLSWPLSEDLRRALDMSYGRERDERLLQALQEHLQAMPERASWNRIEAILPHSVGVAKNGLATKLSGMGVYIQPLERDLAELTDVGVLRAMDDTSSGSNTTIDPKTGNKGRANTFVAPFFYFDRVTLDARTLQVLSRKPQFDHTKYHDPNSDAIHVGQQMKLGELLEHLGSLVERAAYKSVRNSSVEAGPVRATPTSDTARSPEGSPPLRHTADQGEPSRTASRPGLFSMAQSRASGYKSAVGALGALNLA